jgi:hypothetical protein
MAPVLPNGGAQRSESGVVAAASVRPEIDESDEETRVGPGSVPMPAEQQEALARRIRHALGQTLPLGTPVPATPPPGAARSLYSRTMMLGGRQEPGLRPSEPPVMSPVRNTARFDAIRSEELRDEAARLEALRREGLRSERGRTEAMRPEMVTPVALSPLPPQAFPPGMFPSSERVPAEEAGRGALRSSFMRPVGTPSAPPPRRSRRPAAPGMEAIGESASDAVAESDHEAFALDRPLSVPPGVLPSARRGGEPPAPAAYRAAAGSSRGAPALRATPVPSSGVRLPPPPQPGDYELASSPSSLPPSPRFQPPAAVAAPPVVPRAPARPLLSDLPSANPFEGFEAPRESFAQRSLIVFVVALAVVGLFALAALAFGFLGFGKHW